MELNVGPEQPLPGIGEHATVLTQVIVIICIDFIIFSFCLSNVKVNFSDKFMYQRTMFFLVLYVLNFFSVFIY